MTKKPKLNAILNWTHQKPNSEQLHRVLTPLFEIWAPHLLPFSSQITPEDAQKLLKKIDPNIQITDFAPFRDLRGVECPRNYIKTSVALGKIPHKETLEIWIDEGQPIENVPIRLKHDGHTITKRQKCDGYWKLFIQKN